MIQEQLNKISETYTIVPKVAVNGQYNQQTADSVSAFQQTFDLPATGIVDFPTWYKICNICCSIQNCSIAILKSAVLLSLQFILFETVDICPLNYQAEL
jgi:hypothetical protein